MTFFLLNHKLSYVIFNILKIHLHIVRKYQIKWEESGNTILSQEFSTIASQLSKFMKTFLKYFYIRMNISSVRNNHQPTLLSLQKIVSYRMSNKNIVFLEMRY